MTDYEIDASVNTSAAQLSPEQLAKGYGAVDRAEQTINDLEANLVEALPDKFDMCNIGDLLSVLGNFASSISSVIPDLNVSLSSILNGTQLNASTNTPDTSTSFSIPANSTSSCAVQIILKKYQILKLRIEKLVIAIELIGYQVVRLLLKSLANGTGTQYTAPIAAALAILSALATVLTAVMNALSIILGIMNMIPLLNLDGESCAFFLTPKSLNTTKINILNINQSLTNPIPQAMLTPLQHIKWITEESNDVIKKANIAACAAAGAASAESGKLDTSMLNQLERPDCRAIMAAVNLFVNTVGLAEGLPRYERLSITNLRFMLFLLTGFELAAKQSFGIPGMP